MSRNAGPNSELLYEPPGQGGQGGEEPLENGTFAAYPPEPCPGARPDEPAAVLARLRAAHPDYRPPPFSPAGLAAYLEANLDRLPPGAAAYLLDRLRHALDEEPDGWDAWQDVWDLLHYSGELGAGLAGLGRLQPGQAADEWGFDRGYFERLLPLMRFLFRRYWRVEVTGLENVPAAGRALLVANHSGQFPFDGAMITYAVRELHPARRLVRGLYGRWFPSLPFLSQTLSRIGQVYASETNALRLLAEGQLVSTFPEGFRGIRKPYNRRYQLQRFGRGGMARLALQARAPVVPVAIVGAEEIYMNLGNVPLIEKLVGLPLPPLTPAWPWLGLLGAIPLPSKWTIDFGPPLRLDAPDRDPRREVLAVTGFNDQVRNVIQEMIYRRLARRRSVLWG